MEMEPQEKNPQAAKGGGGNVASSKKTPVDSKTKVIAKLYLQMNGEDIDSMLQETGQKLYSDKEYIITMMIEEVVKK